VRTFFFSLLVEGLVDYAQDRVSGEL